MGGLGGMWKDRRWIWKLQRGDVQTLRLIYDKYKLDPLKLALLLTGDIHSAEDAVQDVFLRLAESFDRVSDYGNLKNFLITCLMNRTRTLRRDDRRRRTSPLEEATLPPAPVEAPDRWAVVNEEMQRISRAIAELPAEQREVVTLRFEAGLGFSKIAQIQGASVNTVQGRYRYGMAKLRSLLDGEVET